jgi:hypothetical protein
MTRINGALRAAVALIPITAIALMLFDPIPQPAQSIIVLALAAAAASIGVRAWFASRDDVVKEAARVAIRWGAFLGFWTAIATVLVVRYAPPVSDALVQLAAVNENAPPSTVGFGVGVAFSFVCILLASVAVWVGWWLRKR